MDEKDQKYLAEMFALQLEQIKARMDARFAESEQRLGAKVEESERRIMVFLEAMERKIDLVIEGQQMQVEHADRVESELLEEAIPKVDRRVTTVVADLRAHKADPEAHQRGYSVKEGEDEYGKEQEKVPPPSKK